MRIALLHMSSDACAKRSQATRSSSSVASIAAYGSRQRHERRALEPSLLQEVVEAADGLAGPGSYDEGVDLADILCPAIHNDRLWLVTDAEYHDRAPALPEGA
jgi:hypothetical protein